MTGVTELSTGTLQIKKKRSIFKEKNAMQEEGRRMSTEEVAPELEERPVVHQGRVSQVGIDLNGIIGLGPLSHCNGNVLE